MPVWLAVIVGGAGGSLARFGVVLAMRRAFGPVFPWGTLAVNLAGSFLIGMLWGYFFDRPAAPEWLRIGLMTGVMGGFTTLSSVSLETTLLAESGALGPALLNFAGNTLLGLLFCVVGLALARSWFAA